MNNKAIENENDYKINRVIDDIALFYTADNEKSGLMNLSTKEVVSNIDDFYTIYDEEGHFYYQTKSIILKDSNNNIYWEYTINIYDTLNKKMLIEDANYSRVNDSYGFLILKKGENYHIFDEALYRQGVDILKYNFANIEKLKYTYLEPNFLKVTVKNKKGLYVMGKGIIVQIEYDNIEDYHKNEVLIFTKDNKKYFCFYDYFKRKKFNGLTPISNAFDDITISQTDVSSFNDWVIFMYCKINNIYYVYDLPSKKLLLKINCEEIEVVTEINHKLIFKIKQDGKYGLISCLSYPYNKIEIKTILMPIYQNITLERGKYIDYFGPNGSFSIFYLETSEGMDLYILNSNNLIQAKCRKITYLGNDYFAFYHGLNCDIVAARNPLNTIIQECEIKEKLDTAIIYKKNYLLGLVLLNVYNSYLIEPNYTKINYLNSGYSIIEENDKKIFYYLNKPLTQKYDDINVADYSSLGKLKYYGPAYVALKRKRNWLLTKLNNHYGNEEHLEKVDENLYTEILFLHDIIALRNEEKLAIYNSELELLATYPKDTEIYEVNTNPLCYGRWSKYMYVIDDWYYRYKDTKWEEIFLEDAFLNVVVYESIFGYVAVNDFSKDKFDEKISEIREFSQSGMDKVLANYLLKREDLQEKYPQLVRKNDSVKSFMENK